MQSIKKCPFEFVNNSKTHKRGEICGNIVRCPNEDLCWKHKTQKTLIKNKNQIQEIIETTNNINNSKVTLKNEFIQLENS